MSSGALSWGCVFAHVEEQVAGWLHESWQEASLTVQHYGMWGSPMKSPLWHWVMLTHSCLKLPEIVVKISFRNCLLEFKILSSASMIFLIIKINNGFTKHLKKSSVVWSVLINISPSKILQNMPSPIRFHGHCQATFWKLRAFNNGLKYQWKCHPCNWSLLTESSYVIFIAK